MQASLSRIIAKTCAIVPSVLEPSKNHRIMLFSPAPSIPDLWSPRFSIRLSLYLPYFSGTINILLLWYQLYNHRVHNAGKASQWLSIVWWGIEWQLQHRENPLRHQSSLIPEECECCLSWNHQGPYLRRVRREQHGECQHVLRGGPWPWDLIVGRWEV